MSDRAAVLSILNGPVVAQLRQIPCIPVRRSLMSNDAMSSDTFREIDRRLQDLNPGIVIANHIAGDLDSGRNTLDGITFTVKDRAKLLEAFRGSKDSIGKDAFAEGSKIDPKEWAKKGIHGDPKQWALRLSFGATDGIGFREIWRMRLTDRELRLSDARPSFLKLPDFDADFSANFGDNPTMPDLSSLHGAVWDEEKKEPNQKAPLTKCNIHIDQMGFVMEGPGDEIIVDPDFLRHLVLELGWKTKLKGTLPNWALDRINWILPSSFNNYSRIGVSIDLIDSKKYKVDITGSCGWAGGFGCSATVNLRGKFDLLGGGR
jgi:hypothetical protein